MYFPLKFSDHFIDHYSILHVDQDSTKKQIKAELQAKPNTSFTENKGSKDWRNICTSYYVLPDQQRRIIPEAYIEEKYVL